MSLERAIKKTIEYAAKFKCQINKKEIESRLISKKVFSKKEIRKILDQMKWVDKKNPWKALKIKKAENLAKEIKLKFKDILFLGVSGSVASGHPKKDDDIDILLITRRNKLWITRLKLRWWIYKNQIPHRRYGQEEKANQFCFNLWLDEDSLKLPKNKQNLKNAVDLILLKPLINKQKIYEFFLRENNWAEKYLATGYSLKPTLPSLENGGLKNSIFIDRVINWMVFWPQFCYMKGKIRKETVGLHQAFFHRPVIK